MSDKHSANQVLVSPRSVVRWNLFASNTEGLCNAEAAQIISPADDAPTKLVKM